MPGGRPKTHFVEFQLKTFGRLFVMRVSEIRGARGQQMCLCRCECGRLVRVESNNLRIGKTNSCGCLRYDTRPALTHGATSIEHGGKSHEYVVWDNMKARCLRPKNAAYKNYGGRGILVCERWMSFGNFLQDMGMCPPGLTIDRFPDNDGNYEPGNCRWATAKEQANNQRQRSVCPEGHPLSGSNVRTEFDKRFGNVRKCLICLKAKYKRANQAKKRVKHAA